MFKALAVASMVVCVVLASSANPKDAFAQFMQTYNRAYGSVEEQEMRFAVFQENLVRIDAQNAAEAAAGGSAVFGVTKFADLTPAEFSLKFKGFKPSANRPAPVYTLGVHASAPTSVDWRKNGVITPVKDQQQCGSCWAFSATEQIESNFILANNTAKELSPQQIVSCDTTDAGCDGGDTITAYQYVEGPGIETNTAYPYTSGGGNSGTCKFKASGVAVKITGFKYGTTNNDETTMAANMATIGPFSVCVATNGWQTYTSGILKSGCGGSADVDHCVQAVGYNDAGASPYWIVRNSWNTDWGVQGYIYVYKGKNVCDIAGEATYVTGVTAA